MKLVPVIPAILILSMTVFACTSGYSPRQDIVTDNSVGARLFEENCQRCHRYADDLKEPRAFLEKTIHMGSGEMPSFTGVLTEEEEKIIAEYIINY